MTQSQAEIIQIRRKSLKRLPLIVGGSMIATFFLTKGKKPQYRNIAVFAVGICGLIIYYSNKSSIDAEEKKYNSIPKK